MTLIGNRVKQVGIEFTADDDGDFDLLSKLADKVVDEIEHRDWNGIEGEEGSLDYALLLGMLEAITDISVTIKIVDGDLEVSLFTGNQSIAINRILPSYKVDFEINSEWATVQDIKVNDGVAILRIEDDLL